MVVIYGRNRAWAAYFGGWVWSVESVGTGQHTFPPPRPRVRRPRPSSDLVSPESSLGGHGVLVRYAVSVLMVGLSYGARNILSYAGHMTQIFLAFIGSPIIP